MEGLPHRLGDLARTRGGRPAVRDRCGGEGTGTAWRFRSWAELEADVARVAAGGAHLPRGERVAWDAGRGVPRVATDLALLHLGVVGEHASGGPVVAEGRPSAGLLVRLRGELRGRDPAAVWGGRVLDHAALVALARGLAGALGAGDDDEVLVGASAAAEQVVGWAAVAGGFALAVGDGAVIADVEPVAWVCGPEELAAVAPPPSRAGVLAPWLRRHGRADARLGRRLRRVVVDGPLPPQAVALEQRGIRVLTLEEACASST